MTPTKFPTRCNVIDGNVVMFHGKLPYEILHTLTFTHRAMLLKINLTPARFPSWCSEVTHISFPL